MGQVKKGDKVNDLRIYYQSDLQVDTATEKEFDKIAKRFNLKSMGSGFEIDTGIRDLHYRRKDETRKKR